MDRDSIKSALINGVRRLTRSAGFDVVRFEKDSLESLSQHFDPAVVETIRAVRPFTLTSPERIAALCEATRYLVKAAIPGDIVECGVWRGGSMMAVAKTLLEMHESSRRLFLYDTFSGMSEPGEKDVTYSGIAARDLMKAAAREDPASIWCRAPLEGVRAAVFNVGYPRDKIHFVQGKVEETIPGTVPERIALLRLDTDWYESTRHELIHLFPRLSIGGVMIIDDYGHWKGARQAVDEYLAEVKARVLLNRIDYTGRIAVKID
jgi:hypothetical protein